MVKKVFFIIIFMVFLFAFGKPFKDVEDISIKKDKSFFEEKTKKTIDSYVSSINTLIIKGNVELVLGEIYTKDGYLKYYSDNPEPEKISYADYSKNIKEKSGIWYAALFDSALYLKYMRDSVNGEVELAYFEKNKEGYISFKDLLIEKKYNQKIEMFRGQYCVYFDVPEGWNVNGFVIDKVGSDYKIIGIIDMVPREWM